MASSTASTSPSRAVTRTPPKPAASLVAAANPGPPSTNDSSISRLFSPVLAAASLTPRTMPTTVARTSGPWNRPPSPTDVPSSDSDQKVSSTSSPGARSDRAASVSLITTSSGASDPYIRPSTTIGRPSRLDMLSSCAISAADTQVSSGADGRAMVVPRKVARPAASTPGSCRMTSSSRTAS